VTLEEADKRVKTKIDDENDEGSRSSFKTFEIYN